MNPVLFGTIVWIGARYGGKMLTCETKDDWKKLFAEIKEREFVKPATAVTAATLHGIKKVDKLLDTATERYSDNFKQAFDQFTEWVDKNFESFQARVDAYMTRWQKTGTTEPKDPE